MHTYVGPMCTMWVPKLPKTYVGPMCQCEYQQIAEQLCRPYVHNVSTNKLPKQPM